MLQMIADRRSQRFVLDVPSVSRCGRLEEQHVHFIIRSRPMLDASRHDHEFPFRERHDAVSELDAE